MKFSAKPCLDKTTAAYENDLINTDKQSLSDTVLSKKLGMCKNYYYP
jgi:hypothetical protein